MCCALMAKLGWSAMGVARLTPSESEKRSARSCSERLPPDAQGAVDAERAEGIEKGQGQAYREVGKGLVAESEAGLVGEAHGGAGKEQGDGDTADKRSHGG